jgi:hypothetical protein
MNTAYLEVISLVERLHRHFLEVVKLELEGLGIHDINNVQGMMLFNIGDAEMTVGELTLRAAISVRTSPTTSRRWSRTGIWRSSARSTTGVRSTST